ncbi:STYKc [Musa troglodytarum]|uniref:STYKc n=1 Tax=Musa troglodytarum TaxID=320322 RepID=A0A9E7HRQ2_9LILI|nr:STYKc [Musa troglodytarum]
MASPFRPPLLLLLPTLRHIPPPPAAGRGEGPIAAAPTVGAPLATHRLLLALGNGLVASPVLGGAGVGRVQVLLAVERGRYKRERVRRRGMVVAPRIESGVTKGTVPSEICHHPTLLLLNTYLKR